MQNQDVNEFQSKGSLQANQKLRQDSNPETGKPWLTCALPKLVSNWLIGSKDVIKMVSREKRNFSIVSMAGLIRSSNQRFWAVRFFFLFLIFTFLTAQIFTIQGIASENPPSDLMNHLVGQDDKNQAWQIEADEISYDDKTLRYTARGNVVISKGSNQLTADVVNFNRDTMKASAHGNVKFQAGNDVLTGNSMDVDLNSQTGTIINGTIFLKENNFHIRGEKIEKLSENTYTIEEAAVTTCDINDPDWIITGKKLKVTLEGYGYVTHAAFWAKDVPVIYTPYLFFPAKTKRQTGLLPPEAGSSKRLGRFYIQPFFWAINESMDATFYEHYMSYRGNKLGSEFRYVLSKDSKGALMYDYLKDRQIDDGIGDSSEKWGYEDKPENELRPNSRRYWLRMYHQQDLPWDFIGKLNLDFVSDQDYLIDFKDGYTGFEETEKYYKKEFGWELDDYNDPKRLSKLGLYKNWDQYSFNMEALWYDDVIKRRWKDIDDTLQRLPFIGLDAAKQQIFKSAFYFDLDSEYNYFYRKDGDRGHRGDLHPRFYLPYRFKNYFSIEPSLGLRETAWYFDPENENDTIDEDKTHSRELYDFRTDLSSEVFKTFTINGKTIDKIKHSIKPEVKYEYIPEVDQDEFPYFDEIDRISKKNLVTYSITNTLTSRSKRVGPQFVMDDEQGQIPDYIYNPFLYLKLEQSYDIAEAREDDPTKWSHEEEKRPYGPIKGELEFKPFQYLVLNADASWDIYEHEFQTRNVSIELSDKRNDKLFVEYRFNREKVTESIYYDFLLNLSERISLYAEHERNITKRERILTSLGFIFRADCWTFNIRYMIEDDDRKFEFSVDLTGLGKLGSKRRLD